jgi:hypothetical protein
MLEKIISKARRMLADARQRLPAESAAAVEQVYNDIVALKEFIAKELSAVENDSSLDALSKKAARREIFEKAGRKLEVIKTKRRDTGLYVKISDTPATTTPEDELLQFMREKEVRDRLSGMTEAQILALFGESLRDETNPLLLKAILNSPAGFEPVSKETVKKIQQMRAGKISPKVADEPKTVPNLASAVEELFSLLKTELDSLRRHELPPRLSGKKDTDEPPFKF